jgi:shikimate kinase / 3-dehydroquinate synthase
MNETVKISENDPTEPATLTRTIVLVGLMGAGKSCIGRRLAQRLNVSFVDADFEIEQAAGCTITEIFEKYGETAFRDGERSVMARLLKGPPTILAAGGGAFMDAETRALVRQYGISVWLRADLDTLAARTKGRSHRPLLNSGDPRDTLAKLIEIRYPVYAEANITVDTGVDNPNVTCARVVDALAGVVDAQAASHAMTSTAVAVALGTRAYDIHVGRDLLKRAGALCAPLLKQRRIFVVTDSTVAPLYLAPLTASFTAASIRVDHTIIPAGETSKDFAHLEQILDAMLAAKCERGTMIVALGGGVVGDLAGFAASVLLRGVEFIQVPTTLLAQVDSSVGGKTGINTKAGKNLVGSFHQPRLVLADTNVLVTLPRRELLAGYAEVVKYGLLGDAGFWGWLESNGAAALAGDEASHDLLRQAIVTSCEAKARIVAADEKESGERALLNLGHTFGHAFEAEMVYDGALLHGEAVAMGMVMAFELSARLGLCPPADVGRIRKHFIAAGLPVAPMRHGPRGAITPAMLMEHMTQDKKMKDGALTFVLAHGIGKAFLMNTVPPDELEAVLAASLAA